jgi:periplasmic divalent cation tolerance protein
MASPQSFINTWGLLALSLLDRFMVYWNKHYPRRIRMDNQPIIVFITAPSKEIGKQIATALVEEKLAACVNILGPVNSIYAWDGKIIDDEEVLLIAKSRSGLFDNRLVPAVQAIHPYEIPEIIALPVALGLHSYLEWVLHETGLEA